MAQLQLFETKITEQEALWQSVTEIKTSTDKVRRRLFSEIHTLKSEIIALKCHQNKPEYRKKLFTWRY